jgi:hypothetical protein
MKAKEKEFAGYLKESAGTTKGKAKTDPVEKPPVVEKKEPIAAKVEKKTPTIEKKDEASGNNKELKIPVFKGSYKALNWDSTIEVPPDIARMITRPSGKKLEVAFSINNSMDRGTAKNGELIAIKVMREFKKKIGSFPDGTLLYNKPHAEDGFKDQRISLYTRAGFGKPTKSGGMYGVVIAGKIKPISKEEYTNLVAASKT